MMGLVSSVAGVLVIRNMLMLSIVLVFGGCIFIAIGGLKLAQHHLQE
jgi:hypothetical protein